MRILLVALCFLTLVRCQSGGSTPPGKSAPPPQQGTPAPPATPPPAPTPPPAAGVTARLDVSVVLEQGGEPRRATLECGEREASTGFIEDAAAACRTVAAQRKFLLDGPPEDRICTMIYGGPQVASVTGTIDGRSVHREIRRTNGCGISDWSSLAALLGSPEPAAGSVP